jgi:bifunctional UDP-N-acetylglucosamine pyrophosphorylase / glucosamine-1-phosphate N-acetyltransferase
MRSRIPKLLHPLCGRAMIGWPVAAARAAGAGKIVVVDSPKRPLQDELADDIVVAIQEQSLGTGDAVRAAAEHFTAGTVVVLNGDVPLLTAETIVALAAAHEADGAAATVATVVLDDPAGYGRVVRDGDGNVAKVVETKKPGDATVEQLRIREVNAGLYAFDGALLGPALERIGTDNSQGEYYLPDVLAVLAADRARVYAYALDDPLETFNINDRRELAHGRAIAQRRICETHMLAGATIVNPEATVIDVDVTLAEDVVVAPFTSLHGATSVAAGSTIGPHSTLIDARVGEGARVLHSYVVDATIGNKVSVGPFAYLRPGTVLRDGSKAGTFVEIKNSDVGAGSKVPHLSYIGDADIGEGTNIGAATITANYDGFNKHRTTIGSGVKTSVDTTLVAPVELGDDSYTAAGSVITKDVPEGSLGVARARQENVDGYADKRRGQQKDAATDGKQHG